jgi:hypothetical protein
LDVNGSQAVEGARLSKTACCLAAVPSPCRVIHHDVTLHFHLVSGRRWQPRSQDVYSTCVVPRNYQLQDWKVRRRVCQLLPDQQQDDPVQASESRGIDKGKWRCGRQLFAVDVIGPSSRIIPAPAKSFERNVSDPSTSLSLASSNFSQSLSSSFPVSRKRPATAICAKSCRL